VSDQGFYVFVAKSADKYDISPGRVEMTPCGGPIGVYDPPGVAELERVDPPTHRNHANELGPVGQILTKSGSSDTRTKMMLKLWTYGHTDNQPGDVGPDTAMGKGET
jgi:hypothetical protein